MQRHTLLASTTFALATTMATALADTNPYSKPDDTWISIDGTVKSVSKDAFMLDYGEGNVLVEMDDGDRDADGYKLVEGDEVSVTGMIDDDFYEATKIEASSVYVENLGTYFYASAIDEEDTFVSINTPLILSRATLQGRITSVDGDSFTLDTGPRRITVDVDGMGYNPLDEKGYQQLQPGDQVSVTGDMDTDFFTGRVFEAEAVTTLRRDRDDA